jgi:cytochrome c biogenesis protein CcdA
VTPDVILPVLGLAVVDAINPSALVATLYLLSQPRATPKVLVYMGAVFLTYFTVGCVLMLGLGAITGAAGNALKSPFAYVAQGLLGAALLLYSFIPNAKQAATQSERPPSAENFGALFLLGISVTGVEMVTALPYLGAVGILTNAQLTAAQWLPILLIYNLIFVLPPLTLLAIHHFFSSWLERHFADARERLRASVRETMLWILGIVGFFLLADSLRALGAFNHLNLERWFGRR